MDYLRDDRDSSQSSQESEFLEMKLSPLRCAYPPGTSSSAPTATAQASMPIQLVVEDTEKSKWKPLVGTPSKSPIPENILVPDPSTPRTVSDTDSSARLTSSTPRSFIRNRRQGEHTSRPPAFLLANTPTRAAPPPMGKTGLDVKVHPYTIGLLDDKAPDVDNGGIGSPRPKRPPRPSASQTPVFSDLARENPEYYHDLDQLAEEWSRYSPMVNAMRNSDPLAHFNSGLAQGQDHGENDPPNDFASRSSVDDLPGPFGSSVNDVSSPSQPANTWRGVENVQKGSQPPSRLFEEPPRTARTEEISTSKPTRANSTQSTDRHQRDSETSGAESDHGEPSGNPLGDCVSNVSTTGARPYAHIETSVLDRPNAAEEVDFYLDLRCKPHGLGSPDWNSNIRIGSQIAFIGSTRWSNEKGEGVYDVGIPYGTQCYVARIFNDCWALCLKLERGLEPYDGDQSFRLLDRFRRSRGPKIVDRGGKPSIALKNHPVVAIYAPLCAFTLAANYGPFEERREAVGARTTGLSTWEGGMIQAANRGASSRFEDEAKRAWKVYVPLQVWNQYLSFCRHSQQTTDALDEIIPRDNASSEGALVNQDLSGRGRENISTGRQLQSLISKGSTVKAIKNTANRVKKNTANRIKENTPNRVKSVFKPESVAASVPSNTIDISRRAPHPVYGNPSDLAPERSNIIPSIVPQLALRPFDDDQFSEFSRPLASLSPNILSSPDLPLLETPHDGDVAQQSSDDGNNQSQVANELQALVGVNSSGGPIQGDPHPGVEVSAQAGLHPGIEFVRVDNDPQNYEYRVVPIVEPPERQGDVIVPVINPPDNPDAGAADMRSGPVSTKAPFLSKKIIRDTVDKVSLERTVKSLATLFRRRFPARAGTSQSPEGRIRRHNTFQNSVSNVWNSIQPGRRRHSMTHQGVVSQEGRIRRHNTFQDSVSNMWNSIQPGRRRHSMTHQGVASQEGRIIWHNPFQDSVSNPWNSIQPGRRRHSMTHQGVASQEGRIRRHNPFQDSVSNAWNSIPSSGRRGSMMPQAWNSIQSSSRRGSMMPQATTPEAFESEEGLHQGADELNQPEISRELDHTNQGTISLPIERLNDIQPLSPLNPGNAAPNPRPLPVPGGLRAHLRNVAPHSWVRHRLRSTESNRLSI